MSKLEKMGSNFGAFVTSPTGLVLVVAIFLVVAVITLLVKKTYEKVRISRNYKEVVKILREISAALNNAATQNPHKNIRVRTIHTATIKMVAVDCILPLFPKSYRVLEVQLIPRDNVLITIRRGSTCQLTNKMAAGQLAALCEAVKKYHPAEARR